MPKAAVTPPSHTGHRERLRERFITRGHDALADYELLELVLMLAIPRRDVKPLAKALLAKHGSLSGVLNATEMELKATTGMGDYATFTMRLISSFHLRAKRGDVLQKPAFKNKFDLLDYLYDAMSGLKHEEFRVLYLDSKNNLVDEETLFRGTINASAVYPREIVRSALNKGATGLVLVHNHPSGDPEPSMEDHQLTSEISAIVHNLSLRVIDHIIIGDGRHYSFADHGRL